MRHKKCPLSALLLLGFGLAGLQAQESLNIAGGDAVGSAGSVSYSLGQIVYTSNTGTYGSIDEGVQQPFEIYIVTGIDEAEGIHISVSVFPNPTSDYLILSIEDFDISNLVYQLYDMNGKLYQNQKIISKQTYIDMMELAPASYFVKVIDGHREVKTFIVIKQ